MDSPVNGAGAEPLLERVRRLFAGFMLLTLLVEVLEWIDADGSLWPQRYVAAGALLVAAAWTLWLYRRGAPHWLADAILLVSIVGAAWGLDRAGAVLALLVGVATFRPAYGDSRNVVGFAVGLVATYVVSVGVVAGPVNMGNLGTVTVCAGVVAILAIMRMVAETLERHDQGAEWDAALTDAATDLVGAQDEEVVHDVLASTLARIVEDLPETWAVVWRSHGEGVGRVRSVGAEPPHPTGDTPADTLMDEPREHLRQGQAITLRGSDAAEIERRVGGSEREATYQAAPLRWGGNLHGALAVGGPGALPEHLLATLHRLAADASLALERLESEWRFRTVAEASRDGIYLLQFRPTTVLHYANHALADLLGFGLDELMAEPGLLESRLDPDDRQLLVGFRESGRSSPEPLEVRVQRRDGAWIQAEISETVLVQGSNMLLAQGVVRDVTRRHEQEEAVREALRQEAQLTEELRRLDNMKSAFLAAVSHELRTPLTAVVGSAQTIRDRSDALADDQRATLVDVIHRNGVRLQRLLTDLLDVDRLARGIVEANRGETDVARLTRRMIAGVEPDGHHVIMDPTGPVVAFVDAPMVERIVENLVRNAIKHTPRGTTIHVSVRREVEAAVIVVEDDGPGVPTDLRQRLFEPFAQGPAASHRAAPGTGIGLTLVARLAELHGGRAWIEDAPSGGARFVVLLPDPDEATAERVPTPGPAVSATPGA